MDALKNFAYSLVATAPSPATSGTSLVVTAGQGAYFPATPFDATIWPSGAQPTNTNAEIVRVTNVSTDTFTITRAQYGTTAQSIAVGYQIAQTVDANLLNQLAPLSGATFTGEVVAPDFKITGLTGATAGTSRLVGTTSAGPPTTGTFATGDLVIDQTATIWVCTAAGTPGTWSNIIPNSLVVRSATATAGTGEFTIFGTSGTSGQTITLPAVAINGAVYQIKNLSAYTVNILGGTNSISVSGTIYSASTPYTIPLNAAYTFVYSGGVWFCFVTTDINKMGGLPLAVTGGGTGTATAPAVGSIPVATSTSAYTPLAIGTNGQVLTSNGTTASWQAVASVPLATVDLTAQSAAISATTLYTPPTAGIYTITYYAKVTTAATTSSVLGAFSVISTDTDSNVVTTVGNTSTQNSLTTGFISGTITVYAKASTAIQYTMGYTSSGATAMQYELHMAVSGSSISTSTGTVTSFNGRSGTVTPGNADYLAVPTGGLTGATAATRYVGGTTSGAPVSGTFAVGDHIVDQTGKIYVCTVAGTPGTWTQVGSTNATQLQGTNISSTAPTSNQVLAYNSGTSAWTPTTASSGLSAVSGNITTANFANATIPASTFVTVSAAQNGLFTVVNGSKDAVAVNSLKNFLTVTGDTLVYVEPASTGFLSSFTASTLSSSTAWQSITYGNGKYVAISNSATDTTYSTDGITWTAGSMPSNPASGWLSITYGNGKFVAVAYGTVGAYSTNGVTWTASTMPSANWYSVTYGNGKFVAVSFGTNATAYSTDGITWASATLSSSDNWQSVTYGNARFVAVATSSSNVATYSTDGITWTATSLPSFSNWQSVAYGNGKYVTIANGPSNVTAYSTDGITWTAGTLPSSSNWQSVTYGNGQFVSVSYSTNKWAYSNDGITWTAASLPSTSTWYSVTYGNGKFVTVATGTTKASYLTMILPKPTPFTILPVNITTNY